MNKRLTFLFNRLNITFNSCVRILTASKLEYVYLSTSIEEEEEKRTSALVSSACPREARWRSDLFLGNSLECVMLLSRFYFEIPKINIELEMNLTQKLLKIFQPKLVHAIGVYKNLYPSKQSKVLLKGEGDNPAPLTSLLQDIPAPLFNQRNTATLPTSAITTSQWIFHQMKLDAN